jgi:hypothetical protein
MRRRGCWSGRVLKLKASVSVDDPYRYTKFQKQNPQLKRPQLRFTPGVGGGRRRSGYW